MDSGAAEFRTDGQAAVKSVAAFSDMQSFVARPHFLLVKNGCGKTRRRDSGIKGRSRGQGSGRLADRSAAAAWPDLMVGRGFDPDICGDCWR